MLIVSWVVKLYETTASSLRVVKIMTTGSLFASLW